MLPLCPPNPKMQKTGNSYSYVVSSTLTALGFALNIKKYILEPIDFLCMTIDSKKTKIYISTKGQDTENKRKRIQACPAQQSHSQTDLTTNWTYDIVTSSCFHGTPLYQSTTKSKDPGSYNSEVIMEMKDLQWWIQQLQAAHGRPIIRTYPQIALTSDTSKTGWGASCLPQRTGGRWTPVESSLHINVLELTAAWFALKSFESHVLVEMDNDLPEQDGRYSHKGPVRLSFRSSKPTS